MTNESGPQKACHDKLVLKIGASQRTTYSSDGFHAQDKSILGQVARVAQRVLLPQLAEQILHAAHASEVVGEVALEERVDAPAQHEPHHDGHVRLAGARAQSHEDGIGDAEDDGAPRREHANQLERVPVVGDVAHDLDAEGVVGVQGHRRGRIGSHGDSIAVREDRLKRGGGRRENTWRSKGARLCRLCLAVGHCASWIPIFFPG